MRELVSDVAFRLRYHPRRRSQDLVVVYTMGKVGSTAIAATVLETIGLPVIQTHHITTAGLDAAEDWHRQHGTTTAANRHGHNLRWRIGATTANRKTDIVCGVRDPLACDIAAAFQIGHRIGLFDQDQLLLDQRDIDRILSYVDKIDRHPMLGSTKWLDQEFGPATGIDVYRQPFDCESGYGIYMNDRCRVLLLRFEDLPSSATAAFEAFFSVPGVVLQRRNVGAEKKYAHLYRQFTAQASIPTKTLDRVYGSRYARHFYTEAEIARQRARWSGDFRSHSTG